MHDSQFNTRVVDKFEYVRPGFSRYLLIHPSRKSLMYKQPDGVVVSSLKKARDLLKSGEVKVLFFHSLKDIYSGLFEYIARDVVVVWIGFGYDYYDRLLYRKFPQPSGLLEPETLRHFYGVREKLRLRARKSFYFLKSNIGLFGGCIQRRELSRINIFIPVYQLEWEWSRDLNKWFSAEFFQWDYRSAKDVDLPRLSDSASDIVIGNSASIENNHIDAFKSIAESAHQGDFDRVICPLSYGDRKFGDQVAKLGNFYFGKKFFPLREFLSQEEYWPYIYRCHTFVMNHKRQQAGGHVERGFGIGARVILNEKGFFSEFAYQNGLIFDSLGGHKLGHLPASISNWNRDQLKKFRMQNFGPVVLENFISHLKV